MPFLLAEILNFQGSSHLIGVGSLSQVIFQLFKYLKTLMMKIDIHIFLFHRAAT